MASWWALAIAVMVILVVGVVVLVAVRSRRNGGDPSSILRVTRFVAIAYAVLVLVGTTVTVLQVLREAAVHVTMPVRTFWPKLYPSVEILGGPTAEVTGGGFERAEVIVTGLDMPARLLLAGGHALQGVTMTLIAATIALVCTRLLAGSPFRPVVSRSMTIAAAAIAIGGTAWQVCFELAGARASAQVLTVSGWTADVDVISDPGTDIGWPDPSFGFELEFWPLLLGLALAALAAAFRHGERLQRDTDGLV